MGTSLHPENDALRSRCTHRVLRFLVRKHQAHTNHLIADCFDRVTFVDLSSLFTRGESEIYTMVSWYVLGM